MKIKLTRRVTLLSILLLFSFFVFGYLSWQWPTTKTRDDKLQLATSFYPVYFFVSDVAGDKARVINITPPGVEPHDYEPTSQDIIQIVNSRLLFLNGGVEPWGQKMQENLKDKNTRIVELGKGLISQDPHIWLSPTLAKTMVNKILQEFISIDEVNREYYTNNATVLKMRLDELDKKYQSGLKNCQTRDFVTSHAAFGYLATAYGLKQIAISGLSPDEEPSLQQLAKIASLAKNSKIKYIFFESLVSPKLSETLAKEIGAKTLVLNPLEGLNQEEIASGKNYFTEMENNLQNLRIALQCQ